MPRESGSSSTGLGHHHHSHHNQQQQHSSHHHRSSPSGERTITGVPVSSSPRNTPPTPAIREVASASTSSANGSEQHCLETLLRNIEGLLAIAAHNARQQQSQLHLQKGRDHRYEKELSIEFFFPILVFFFCTELIEVLFAEMTSLLNSFILFMDWIVDSVLFTSRCREWGEILFLWWKNILLVWSIT